MPCSVTTILLDTWNSRCRPAKKKCEPWPAFFSATGSRRDRHAARRIIRAPLHRGAAPPAKERPGAAAPPGSLRDRRRLHHAHLAARRDHDHRVAGREHFIALALHDRAALAVLQLDED